MTNQTQISALQIADELGQPRPTGEQIAVIEASPKEPLLVVAGAGSGKTETMAARVVWLVANRHVAPEQILGLTFTRKAAGELALRIRGRLKQLRGAGVFTDDLPPHERALATPTIMTYNAYAARLVSEHALRLGVEPDAVTLSEAGQWQLVHEIVNSWPTDLEVSAAESTVINAVIQLAGSCAEHLIEPEQVADYLNGRARQLEILAGEKKLPAAARNLRDRWLQRANLIPVVESYIARKRRDNLLDFSDQVSLIAALVSQDEQIGAVERERFQAVLLDEYQDTSHAQVTLLSGLFGGGHPVTAVGDPLQAIYGWRGASAGALTRFPQVFPARDEETGETRPASHTNLTIAWRNDEAILNAANRTAAPLLLSDSSNSGVAVKRLQKREGAGAGAVSAAYLETDELEAQKIAEFMVAHRGSNKTPNSKPVSAAVLCRTRGQFDGIMAALMAADVPVEVVGLGGLLNTPEVTDVVAMLQVMHDPSRGDALIRLLTNPRWNFGIRDLHALAAWSRRISGIDRDDRSIIDALDELTSRNSWTDSGPEISETGRNRLRQLGNQLRELRTRTGMRLVELISEVERALLFDIEFAIDPVRSAQSLHHLEQFREVAARFETSGGIGAPVTLGGFLDWLEVAAEEEHGLAVTNVAPNPDAVQLLTIHAAKGLEWDVVAVAGLVEGTFPSCRPPKNPEDPVTASGWLTSWAELPYELRGDADGLPVFGGDGAQDVKAFNEFVEEFKIDCGNYELEEERRLAYVAFTRARHSLFLTGSWWRGERKKPAYPSRFLSALVRSGTIEGQLLNAPVNEENPMSDIEDTATWPLDVASQRREQLQSAAQRINLWLKKNEPEIELVNPDVQSTDEISTWRRHAALLLAEERAVAAPETSVELPQHLSASSLVSLVENSKEFALLRRRPIPQQPTSRSRLGTAFHTWVEQLYGAPTLVDLDDLPGADTIGEDADLSALQEAFTSSSWAQRQPVALEVDIDTPVGETMIRCRIDAVFKEADGSVTIVDWKTGQPPAHGSIAHRQRSIQLAIYRIAWSRLHSVPLESVDAIFVHVSPSGITEVRALPLTDEELAEILEQQAPEGRLVFG